MKKVVCPACGMVNLERFITFPHCAACGARLSDAAPPRVPFWKRPLSAPLWATTLGLCCAGLGVAGILVARETRRLEEKRMVVYAQIPRRLSVGEVGVLRFGLDGIETPSGGREGFDDINLRLPAALLQNFVLVSISPPPRVRTARGAGLYFDFGRMENDQPLSISLRARRAGTHRLTFLLTASGWEPFEWRGNLNVRSARQVALKASN